MGSCRCQGSHFTREEKAPTTKVTMTQHFDWWHFTNVHNDFSVVRHNFGRTTEASLIGLYDFVTRNKTLKPGKKNFMPRHETSFPSM
jgi:hypothetical protein